MTAEREIVRRAEEGTVKKSATAGRTTTISTRGTACDAGGDPKVGPGEALFLARVSSLCGARFSDSGQTNDQVFFKGLHVSLALAVVSESCPLHILPIFCM